MIIVFITTFNLTNKNSKSEKDINVIIDYIKYVSQELPEILKFSDIQQMKRQTNLDLTYYDTYGKNFISTIEQQVNWQGLNFKARENKNIYYAQTNDGVFFKVPSRRLLVSYFFPKKEYNTIFLVLFFSLILLLIICYQSINIIINPLHKIMDGIKEFSNGNLAKKIDLNTEDDFGQLASQINNLARSLKKQLDNKTNLLLAIGHEVRTPLAKIQITNSLPSNAANKERIKTYIQEITTLLDQLIASEQINKGEEFLNKEATCLEALIKNHISDLFFDHNIKLHLQKLPEIKIDKNKIILILNNIIRNAIKYAKQDQELLINLHLYSTKNKNKTCQIIQIDDNGIGIEKKHLDKLVEPFYRVDSSRQKQTGGVGLGLYLVNYITLAHKGVMEIKSSKNIGTSIKIKLPQS